MGLHDWDYSILGLYWGPLVWETSIFGVCLKRSDHWLQDARSITMHVVMIAGTSCFRKHVSFAHCSGGGWREGRTWEARFHDARLGGLGSESEFRKHCRQKLASCGLYAHAVPSPFWPSSTRCVRDSNKHAVVKPHLKVFRPCHAEERMSLCREASVQPYTGFRGA